MTVPATRDEPAPARVVRPAWWRELLLIATTYGAYTLTRNTLPSHRARAAANALDLYRAERRVHLDVERALNDVVAGQALHPLSVLANYTYALSHLGVTVAVLVWLYVAHVPTYRLARTALLATTVVGLVGFWLYPLAPPRFFPQLGFVDTVVRDGTWGSWGSNAFTAVSNQYAAMPSIHVAWSIWSAGAVVACARALWLRAVALLYPVVVVLVILGTANHWTLDALGGLVAAGFGAVAAVVVHRVLRRLAGRGARRPRPRRSQPSVPEPS